MVTLERHAHEITRERNTKMTALKELEPERFIYEPDPHPPQNYGERDNGPPYFRLAPPPTAAGRTRRAARRWARKHGCNAAIVTLLLASVIVALAALLSGR